MCIYTLHVPLTIRRICIYVYICIYIHIYVYIYICTYIYLACAPHNCLYVSYRQLITVDTIAMGWLRSVGSIKVYVSFAEYRLFYRALLYIPCTCTSRSVVCSRQCMYKSVCSDFTCTNACSSFPDFFFSGQS